ncbi:MAG: twin-arginine translocase subunit TatC, partial [Verrucomicrobiales bacterium]
QLMDFIKKPVELAGLGATIELPAEIDKLEWRKVQTMAKTAQGLDPAIREAFLGAALTEEDNGLRPFIEALPIFNATLVLDEKTRETFVNDAIKDNPGLRDTVLKMVKLNPKAKVDRQGNMIEMSALRISEAFTLSLKISLIAGIVIAFPLLLYFLAQFIFPGLTAKEKRAILPAVGVGFLLFLGGASFAYWFVTPRVLEFMHGYAESLDVASDWRIGYYVSFVSQLVVIFGLSFELPVVVLTLVKLELLSYEYMARTRAYAVIIIFTVAAIITPTPDAFTLTLLAGPMVFLYEISIWMAFFIDRKRKRLEAEEEAEQAVA